MVTADDLLNELHLIPSSLWGITGPHGNDRPAMARPAVNGLFVHHTVTNVTADPCADAREVCRDGQTRFGLLSYSWLFHPSGVVLAGQETRVGAHTIGHNTTSFGFAAIGTYTHGDVPEVIVRNMAAMAIVLERWGWISKAGPVRPHRAIKATACAGDALSTGGVAIIGQALAQLA